MGRLPLGLSEATRGIPVPNQGWSFVQFRRLVSKGNLSVSASSDLARFWIGVRRQFRQGRIGIVLRIGRLALNALREVRLAAGFLMTAGPIGKANPEHLSSEPTLDICPVPPADTGG